jgi:hypothetical protein
LLYAKKCKSENTPKNCVKKYVKKKKNQEFSRNVCSADQEDSLGKEEPYLRKIKKKDV